MSDKLISTIPLERIKSIQIAVTRGKQTLAQVAAQARQDNPGSRVHVINGSIYNRSSQKAYCHLRADGYTWAEDPYTYGGYAWDTGADIAMVSIPAVQKRNHIACVKLIRDGKPDPAPIYQPDMGGKRGRTAMAVRDGCLLLYVSRDGSKQAATPEALRDELLHSMACRAAMKAGGTEEREQLRILAAEVVSGRVKYCPHGRPVAMEITKSALARHFRRA